MLHHSTALRRGLPILLAAVIAFHTISCGTILYPERRGQPAGRLDWGVVLLDGIGLLLFFIPGVIAFAVDFSTGAIYLPPHEHYGQTDAEEFDAKTWKRVDVERSDLNREGIEKVVRQHTGQSVELKPGTYQVRELEGTPVVPVKAH